MQFALWDWARKHLQPNSLWNDHLGVTHELVGEAWLHCGTGRLCGEGARLCVYRAPDDTLHAMPRSEFHDGRFRELKRKPVSVTYTGRDEMC